MASMRDFITTFSKNNSSFLKIVDGESYNLILAGIPKEVTGKFGPTLEWKFQYEDTGKEISWSNKTKSVLEGMKNLEIGDHFTLSRKGSGTDTKYTITKKSDKVPF